MAEIERGSPLLALLEHDPRPTLVVTLSRSHVPVVYRNEAFHNNATVYDALGLRPADHPSFWNWAHGIEGDDTHATLLYLDLIWTRIVFDSKYVIVSSTTNSPANREPRPSDRSTDSTRSRSRSHGGNGSTPHREESVPAPPREGNGSAAKHESAGRPSNRAVPSFMPEQQPFLDVINRLDWGETPLGSRSTWSPRLRQTVNQLVADSRPMAVYWGPQFTIIYNEAFSKLCGSKHPFLLGKPVTQGWPEVADQLKETMEKATELKRSSMEIESRFFVERSDGPAMEAYLKWCIIPIIDNDKVVGCMHPVQDMTSVRLWERRMKMLVQLGDRLVTSRDVRTYWELVVEELTGYEPSYDVPVAVLYSVQDDFAPKGSMARYDCPKICRLEGAIGVQRGHCIAPDTMRLQETNDGLAAKFREAIRTQHPVVVWTRDGSFPPDLLDGIAWRGFGDPCDAAVIMPIWPTKAEDVMGVLLLGLNPRRPHDKDYQQYISLLSQKLTTSLASTVLLEEEARRGRNAAEQAAYDQAILEEKLAFQTREATESEQRFRAVAEFIPSGMCFGDADGKITFANDAFHRITGLPKGSVHEDGLRSCALEEDRPTIRKAYEDVKTQGHATFEFRIRHQESPIGITRTPTGRSPSFENPALAELGLVETTERHILAMAKAEKAVNGSILRILTCLTDVTAHKKTAEEAVGRAQQAENLKRMAEFATVGMYDMDMQGRLLGANNVFFEMCGIDKVDPAKVVLEPWKTSVADEDLEMIRVALENMVNNEKPQVTEFRLKTTWIAKDKNGIQVEAPRWVLATFMPVKGVDGRTRSFTGCLSDVSLQKWQLERERERKIEAIESKRQQDNFIDMTSHEMRNPLSAIIHCADAIIACLSRLQEMTTSDEKALPPDVDERTEVLQDCIESAETIIACSQHQKRIVDDILTMSKLDSQLLTITPVLVEPEKIVSEALKMFEVEAKRVDITLSHRSHPGWAQLGVEYLVLDPSRVKQVLINLLTNALKFTKGGIKREVSVSLKALLHRPSDTDAGVAFIPSAEDGAVGGPVAGGPAAGSTKSSPVYLLFEVEDTGQGLTEAEIRSLFNRFVQASSRTHVKYGGSGLGLYISRKLAELHGGGIGVSSRPGIGSRFAFYVEARIPNQSEIDEMLATKARKEEEAKRLPRAKLGESARAVGNDHNNVLFSPSLRRSEVPRLDAVLVVEDNLINQQITRRGLAARGFRVDVANHGIEALETMVRSASLLELEKGISVSLAAAYTKAYLAGKPFTFMPPEEPRTLPAGTPSKRPSLPRSISSSNPSRPSSARPPLSRAVSAASATGTSESDVITLPAVAPAMAFPRREKESPAVEDPAILPISLILMDIEMPHMDGLTCTRHLRELEASGRRLCAFSPRIPIIAVSANARVEQVQAALDAGCDDVLVKPYRMPELLEKMLYVVKRMVSSLPGDEDHYTEADIFPDANRAAAGTQTVRRVEGNAPSKRGGGKKSDILVGQI